MKGRCLFVALCALVFSQGRCLAQEQNVIYAITDLGTLGGTSSVGCGLNSRGEVVGFSPTASGQTHAFRWASQADSTKSATATVTVSTIGQTVSFTPRDFNVGMSPQSVAVGDFN